MSLRTRHLPIAALGLLSAAACSGGTVSGAAAPRAPSSSATGTPPHAPLTHVSARAARCAAARSLAEICSGWLERDATEECAPRDCTARELAKGQLVSVHVLDLDFSYCEDGCDQVGVLGKPSGAVRTASCTPPMSHELSVLVLQHGHRFWPVRQVTRREGNSMMSSRSELSHAEILGEHDVRVTDQSGASSDFDNGDGSSHTEARTITSYAVGPQGVRLRASWGASWESSSGDGELPSEEDLAVEPDETKMLDCNSPGACPLVCAF